MAEKGIAMYYVFQVVDVIAFIMMFFMLAVIINQQPSRAQLAFILYDVGTIVFVVGIHLELTHADTVEAAVRSKKNATPGQIEGFIRTLIKGKLNDSQFDECELTFRDLDQIATAFTRVINGIYHKRIEYPPQANIVVKQLQEAKNDNDSHDNQ